MISTALVGFTVLPERAEAAAVGAWVAASVFGLAAGSPAFAVVAGVVSMASSIGLSMGAQKLLMKKSKQESVRMELPNPTSLPAYRFVYGKTWAPGSPAGWVVKGKILYICWLLNSRPSAGPFTVMLDKRIVEKSGNEFDFSGDGAIGTNHPFSASSVGSGGRAYATYWIGRGDQTGAPAMIVSETGGYFTAADGWRGCTVLWARLHCGQEEDWHFRWPMRPPKLNVDGNWSLVYDPRDNQTKFSRNHALIVLDALRSNPVRPYGDDYLRLDTFEWGADVSGQAVAVKAGGTIPRYRCDGILTFTDGTEVEDQLQPLLAAGAARFVRIGGKLAFVPAVDRPSVKTISDITDGQPLDLVRWRSSDEVYTEVIARFPAPDRAYESAETPVHVIPGAQAEDGGLPKRLPVDLDFVSDYRQAQRVAKIMAMRSRMQRQVSAELFPDCFDLVAGSVAALDLPAPYSGWNGNYEVASIEPAAGLNDDESITIRLPAVLTETSSEIHAWDHVTEEQDMLPGNFSGQLDQIQPPSTISIVTGSLAAQISGDTTVPAVLAYWPASASASTSGYEWEWGYSKRVSDGSGGTTWRWEGWRSGGTLADSAADDGGLFLASVPWVQIGTDYRYRVRVRAQGAYGASSWLATNWITATGPAETIPAPQSISASPDGAGRIGVTVQQPADGNVRELLIYGSDSDSALSASLLWTVDAGASTTVTKREAGLGGGVTRYYFARSRDQWGNISVFTDSASATTT
ncbi:MAG: phage tail protein [Paracoccus sp. (in: a-proteobacteria)]